MATRHSIWRGAIAFGLVYVPVQMRAASRDRSLELHMLDKRDFAPIGYQRVNKTTGKAVEWSDIVKGYEYAKGEFVALSDADFKHANLKASETIDIACFTDSADIPPMYFDTPYLLDPTKGGEKVYALLRAVLLTTKKVAVATFVMRGRQHLCAVTADGDSLMLITLRFADELDVAAKSATAAANKSKTAASSAEIGMAKRLVEGMSRPFEPAKFKDTYRNDLMRRIKEKIRKKQTHSLAQPDAPEDHRPKAQVIDLMAALKDSLRQRSSAQRGARARAAAPAKRSKRA